MNITDCTAQHIGSVLTVDAMCRICFIPFGGGARDYIRDPVTDDVIIFASHEAAGAAWRAAKDATDSLSGRMA